MTAAWSSRSAAELPPTAVERSGRPTVAVLVGGTAAAVHVIDDNVVEPGWATAMDHLVSCLVPLAVIAVLVWTSWHARRPGSRAISTVLLGLFGLMLGSEALQHLMTDGPARDDWTGLLATVSGAVLLGGGVRDLWQSRRRGGSRRRRFGRRTLKAVGALVVAVYVVYPIVDAYIGTNTARRTTPTADSVWTSRLSRSPRRMVTVSLAGTCRRRTVPP